MAFMLDGNNIANNNKRLPSELPEKIELPPEFEFEDEFRLSPLSIGSISPPCSPLGLNDLSLKSPHGPVKRRRSYMEEEFPPQTPRTPRRKVVEKRSLMGARISELLSSNAARCFRDLLGPSGGVAWSSCCRATRLVLYSWVLKKAYIWGELNGELASEEVGTEQLNELFHEHF